MDKAIQEDIDRLMNSFFMYKNNAITREQFTNAALDVSVSLSLHIAYLKHTEERTNK